MSNTRSLAWLSVTPAGFTTLSSAALTWPDDTELLGLEFELQPEANTTLFPQYAIGLHAWFLDCVRQADPRLSAYLHDGQSEKPFTLSPLYGDLPLVGKHRQLQRDARYTWRVSLLSAELVNWARDWLRKPPQVIDLRAVRLKVRSLRCAPEATRYDRLYASSDSNRIQLTFLSPTSFRRRGHHFPLPVPVNLFHSYLRRWNDFAGDTVDTEAFLDWVDSHVVLRRHQLASSKVAAGKRGTVTGFTGSVELAISAATRRQHPDCAQLFAALGRYAPYCGTGHKTTFGLGQTRLGWEGEIVETPPEQTRLGERMSELFELLLSAQQRQGGERARRVCEVRATILARREFGESLQAIAADLEMPYETVKTYAKLARRTLKQL